MRNATIIIPVFNQAPLTERCLEALRGCQADIIVVDDGSTDNTAELLCSLEPRVRVVKHSSNQGFSASCNDGAAAATGDYLVFLNNDTVPEPGWLDALVRYADVHPEASVIGAKLLYANNTVQHAGVVICQDGYPRHIYSGFPAEHPAVNKSRHFQIVTGACMMIRREIFMGAGGFDTAFCNGFEDVDLCLRLGEDGRQVHYCADAVVQHLESVSPGRFKHDQDNVSLYRERWLHRVQPDDLQYYLNDGLMQLSYQGTFPITVEISPRLAVLDEKARSSEVERLLEERAQEIADLRRENTRLVLQLRSGQDSDSERAGYDKLRSELREIVQTATPPGSQLLVVSKGDRALLDFAERKASHFPQSLKGTYSGHHPADSFTAIAQLEALRSRGAEYLVFPSTAFWWLQHYRELGHYLASRCRLVTHQPEVCMVFELPQNLGASAGLEDNSGIFETARLEEAAAEIFPRTQREGSK